jgi:parallel beta-helix repeat protein
MRPTRRHALPLRTTLGLAALGGALAVSRAAAPAALGTGPACGDTITRSLALRHDLRDCAADGLIIGADHITLDLNGHTIDGDAVVGGGDTGVRLDGRQHVTVRGGTVQEFDHAVHLTASNHNRLTRLVATRSGDTDIGRAILLDTGSDGNLIDSNDASFNGRSGIALLDSSNNLITRNRTNHNDVAGMGVFGGADNQVTANVMTDNGENGIFWGSGTTGGGLAANVISGNPEVGILMDSADDTTVALNRLVGNGDNLIVFGNHNRVRANVISDAAGCDGGCGFNISVEAGSGNQVTANLVLGGAHDGIRLDTFAPDDLPLTDTVIRANVVRGAAVDGISVGTETDNPVPNARILANQVSRAGDDGIDVRRAGTVLRANRADRNADLGISAVAGVIDGGGNRAAGNGNPAQCVGITCG